MRGVPGLVKKTLSVSKNTTCRKTFGYWIPDHFFNGTRGPWKSARKSCLEGKLPQSRHFVREGGLTESRPETSISNGTLQKFLN